MSLQRIAVRQGGLRSGQSLVVKETVFAGRSMFESIVRRVARRRTVVELYLKQLKEKR